METTVETALQAAELVLQKALAVLLLAALAQPGKDIMVEPAAITLLATG
jgi:hypothetical protein